MMRTWQLNIEELSDPGVSKPGKLLERDETLFLPNKKPEAVARYVSHLNC